MIAKFKSQLEAGQLTIYKVERCLSLWKIILIMKFLACHEYLTLSGKLIFYVFLPGYY